MYAGESWITWSSTPHQVSSTSHHGFITRHEASVAKLRCVRSYRKGTSDEQLSLLEHLSPVHDRLSAVVVTTPQAVALMDAVKSLSFARAVNLPVLGIVENMSGYACPCCGEVSNVFSTGGGEEMARREGVPFLGALPVDTELVTLLDAAEGSWNEGSGFPEEGSRGFVLAKRYQNTPSAKLFRPMLDKLLETLRGI